VILSNLEIQKAIDDGRLKITPEPLPRKITPDQPNSSCPYNTTSVDLRLHSEIAVPKPGKYCNDMTQPGVISEQITKNSTPYTLSAEQPYRLERNQFIIAWTLETVELCIDKNPPYLAARIEGKSSNARCGVLIHFTAPTVHSGWNGRLTLEMINLSPAAFLLTPGMYIAQLILEEVEGEIDVILSQFQNQKTPAGLK
jgi:dCTP deaminase